MTATAVFKDYLFYNRWGFQQYNMYVNTIVLFTLVGLWHAANAYWLLWGFLHGVLFSGYLAWRHYVKPVVHEPGRWPIFSKLWPPVLTYVAVCSCWYLPSKIIEKIGRF
jgi:D-alanyl-lipoteichoic acid acyltransferase DltB (MBOAT superfamily)